MIAAAIRARLRLIAEAARERYPVDEVCGAIAGGAVFPLVIAYAEIVIMLARIAGVAP